MAINLTKPTKKNLELIKQNKKEMSRNVFDDAECDRECDRAMTKFEAEIAKGLDELFMPWYQKLWRWFKNL